MLALETMVLFYVRISETMHRIYLRDILIDFVIFLAQSSINLAEVIKEVGYMATAT